MKKRPGPDPLRDAPAMNDTPPDFDAALAAAGLAEFFAGCTPAHRREYLRWIGEAKRAETRKARIGRAIAMLKDRCAEETARTNTKGPR
jgi:uncharacterized protein YdeI (YjbR/CyaY-like superfamily)